MGKEATLALADVVDMRKPIVKEFVDRDEDVKNFIRMKLDHVPYTTMKINCVYQSADKRHSRFRINFYSQKWNEGEITPENTIAMSKYVEIFSNLDDSSYEMTVK